VKVRTTRGVLIKVNDAGWRSIRLLAFERDATLEATGIEALNDLLKKYGKQPIVENPLFAPSEK
jgi:antitoxin-like ribbon-helix-helix protein